MLTAVQLAHLLTKYFESAKGVAGEMLRVNASLLSAREVLKASGTASAIGGDIPGGEILGGDIPVCSRPSIELASQDTEYGATLKHLPLGMAEN